jgi:hypothetical protein
MDTRLFTFRIFMKILENLGSVAYRRKAILQALKSSVHIQS